MTAPFYEPQRAWMRDAACRGANPAAFFPDYIGIWGGLNPEERKRIAWQRMGLT